MSGPVGAGERRVNGGGPSHGARAGVRRRSRERRRGARARRGEFRRPGAARPPGSGPCAGAATVSSPAASPGSSSPRASKTAGSTGRWVQTTSPPAEAGRSYSPSVSDSSAARTAFGLAPSSLNLSSLELAPVAAAYGSRVWTHRVLVEVTSRRHVVRREQRHEPLGLVLAGGQQRARPRSSPRQALRERAWLCRRITSVRVFCACTQRLVEGVDVELVGQPASRLVDREPGDLVDLRVRLVAADVAVADGAADPVVHQLGADPDRVALAGQRHAEPDPDAGLLLDLAHRGRGRVLAAVELALGERPVVVPRPVHQQHRGGGTQHHRPGRDDLARATCRRGHATSLTPSRGPSTARRRPGLAQPWRRRLTVVGGAALVVVLVAVAAVAGVRWWQDRHRTDLERALAYAPAGTARYSWTDWAGVRRGARRRRRRPLVGRGRRAVPVRRLRRRPHLRLGDGRLGHGAAAGLRLLARRRRLGGPRPERHRLRADRRPAGQSRRRRARRRLRGARLRATR